MGERKRNYRRSYDNLTVTASAFADLGNDPLAGGYVRSTGSAQADLSIFLSFETSAADPAWSCTLTYKDPEISTSTSGGVYTNASADFIYYFANGFYQGIDPEESGTEYTYRSGPNELTLTGYGNETLEFVEADTVFADVIDEGSGGSVSASLDPGLPISFSDLTPGLSVVGPAGNVYAESVPGPSAAGMFGAIVVSSFLRRRRSAT